MSESILSKHVVFEQALAESQADLAAGRFVVESAEHHLARVKEISTQE